MLALITLLLPDDDRWISGKLYVNKGNQNETSRYFVLLKLYAGINKFAGIIIKQTRIDSRTPRLRTLASLHW